jgi:hypothetical protein
MEFSAKSLSTAIGKSAVTITSSWSVVGSEGIVGGVGSLDGLSARSIVHAVNTLAPQIMMAASIMNIFFIIVLLCGYK